MVHGHTPKRTHMPTNERGEITHPKGVGSQGCCISTSWPNYTTHEMPHKEAIGCNLWRAWTIVLLWPTLRPKIMEIYLTKHFKSMKATWKSQWVMKVENSWPENCPKKCCKSLVTCWKTPIAVMENSHMVKV